MVLRLWLSCLCIENVFRRNQESTTDYSNLLKDCILASRWATSSAFMTVKSYVLLPGVSNSTRLCLQSHKIDDFKHRENDGQH